MSAALRRLTIVPFETAVALLLLIQGLTAILHYGLVDPVAALLPPWEADALNVMTVVTGAGMIAGMGLAYRPAEAAGLLFLTAVVLDRFILYGYYLGFGQNFAVTGIFDAAVIWAALVRLNTLRRRQVIIRAERPE